MNLNNDFLENFLIIFGSLFILKEKESKFNNFELIFRNILNNLIARNQEDILKKCKFLLLIKI